LLSQFDPSLSFLFSFSAGCYLILGEVKDAIQGFEKSMDSSNVVCLDRQVVMSASDGIQKSQVGYPPTPKKEKVVIDFEYAS